MEQQHPEFINNLIALRNYYQQLVEDYERQFAHAKKQLSHVNALLDDQMARHKQQKARLSETETAFDKGEIASEIAFDNREIASEVDLDTSAIASKSLPGSPEPDLASPIQESLALTEHSVTLEPTQFSVESATTESTELHSTDFATKEPLEPSGVESAATAETSSISQLSQQQPTASPVATDLKTERSLTRTPQKNLLLPQFQHLNKSEAVEKFLQNNEGKVFYIDDITRALYGELDAEAIQAERPRIYETLKKGVANGLWSVVPNAAKYYTIDLKSVDSTTKQLKPPDRLPKSPRQPSRRSKYSDSMLPSYRQLSFTEAVATVVQSNAGQVLTPERVTRELYGDIPALDLTKAQAQVGKALWAGAKQERWQQVPGQLGQYTLDLKQLT